MKNHSQKDGWLSRLVVAVLGLTVVPKIVGTLAFAMVSPSRPVVIVALGMAAAGGRLAPMPMKR